MKKLFSLALAFLLVFSLTACGASQPEDDGITRIAIVQQMTHSSLIEIRQAVVSKLNKLAQANGLTIEITQYNGENDMDTLNQVGAEIMAGDCDMIIPIATLASQAMVTAAAGQIPVVCAAASDPEGNGLTGQPNVTGTSDCLNTSFIMDMMFHANKKIKTVGLLYTDFEPNSDKAIAEAKAYLEEKGVAYIEKNCSTADEILAAASELAEQAQVVFTPTDNTVMSVEEEVADILNEAGIAQYAGADSFVKAGAFATCSVDYTELGSYTAQMAMDVLLGGEIPEFHQMEDPVIIVNIQTAHADHLDPSAFSDMGLTVRLVGVEVISY